MKGCMMYNKIMKLRYIKTGLDLIAGVLEVVISIVLATKNTRDDTNNNRVDAPDDAEPKGKK